MPLFRLIPQARPISWEDEGEAWRRFLDEALRAEIRAGLSASQWDDHPFPHYRCRILRPRIQPDLWIAHLGDLLVPLVVADSAVDEAGFRAWSVAIAKADERLAVGQSSFEWAAAISPAPADSGAFCLREPVDLAQLRLRPAGKVMTDRLPASPPKLGYSQFASSWPIIVEGRSTGFTVDAAMMSASRDIYRVCLILGAAWRVAWQLRHSPEPSGADLMELPDTLSPPQSGAVPQALSDLPTWATDAFALLAARPEVESICALFREAQLIQADHPTVAFVSYVSVIEAVGRLLLPDGSNRKRFLKALGVVVPLDAQTGVVDSVDLFAYRNETAHEAILHATEFALGNHQQPSLLASTPGWEFQFKTLSGLRHISTELVRRMLSGTL